MQSGRSAGMGSNRRGRWWYYFPVRLPLQRKPEKNHLIIYTVSGWFSVWKRGGPADPANLFLCWWGSRGASEFQSPSLLIDWLGLCWSLMLLRLSLVALVRHLTAVASLCGAWLSGAWASAAAAYNRPAHTAWDLPGLGWTLCLLRWQVESNHWTIREAPASFSTTLLPSISMEDQGTHPSCLSSSLQQ